jgi:hypothetical protein
MAHVLLTGYPPLSEELEDRLHRWGISYERLDPDGSALDHLRTDRFDLIVVACDDPQEGTLCAQLSSLRAAGVPMLLVGGPARACACRRFCQERIRATDLRDDLLRRAFEACLAQPASPADASECRDGLHGYTQFLKHELRTPLTAARAALQVLTREGPYHQQKEARALMRVALRNIERLQRTISWCEDTWAGRIQNEAPRWREVTVARLSEGLLDPDEADRVPALAVRPGIADQSVVTDSEMVHRVNRQVLRALRFFAPDQPLALQLDVRAGAEASTLPSGVGAGCDVVVSYHLPSSQPVFGGDTAVSRTGLVATGESKNHELARLCEFTVSREILSRLHARITVATEANASGSIVELIIPSIAAADLEALGERACGSGHREPKLIAS